MKIIKNIGVSVAVSLAFAISPVSHAGIITTVEGTGIVSTQVAGATTVDFEGLGSITGTTACPAPYTSCTGNYEIRDSDGNVYNSAPPYIATPVGGDWLTVPNDLSSGSATFMLGNNYDYFGLFWGSLDTYNTIEFYSGNILVAGGSFSGGYFAPPLQADGGQTAWSSNRFINFFFTDGDSFDSIKFISTNFAFETDNHALRAAVPEPATLALLSLGLIGLGFSRRKSFK